MEDITKVVLGGAVGSLLGNISYFYQFWRNNRFTYKNRNKYLYKLIVESCSITFDEIDNVNTLIEKIENDPYQMHLLGILTYKPVEFLAEKIVADEYYFAYIRMFDFQIESELYFIRLQSLAIQLRDQIAQVIEMAKDAVLRDNARRKAALETFKAIDSELFKINASLTVNEIVTMWSVNIVLRNFAKFRLAVGKPSIKDLHDRYVGSIGHILNYNKVSPRFKNAKELIDKYLMQVSEIKFQNEAIRDDFQEIHGLLLSDINNLIRVRDYWKTYFTPLLQ